MNFANISLIINSLVVLSFVFGAGSLGYLVIRLSYPEIRVFDGKLKAGYSLFAGWVLVGSSLILDYALSSVVGSSLRGGIFPITLLLCSLLGFVLLRTFVLVNMSSALELGLPISKLQGNALGRNGNKSDASEETMSDIGQQFINIMQAISKEPEPKKVPKEKIE